jgi:hypothetical protein
MRRDNCLLLLLLCFSLPVSAQYYKLSGRVTNNKLEPLALASIKVKNSTQGTVTKEDGTYELKLEEGNYDLIVTMLGFKPQVINLVVNHDYVQNILLEFDEGQQLSEVVVHGKSKDRSEEIIRNVIRHKDQLLAASGAYTCQVYIKATQIDSTKRKKQKKQLPDSLIKRTGMENMSMAEISLQYDHETDTRYKEQRSGVVKRGRPESLFYLSVTEGDFNLYHNLLKSPVLAAVPFLSPVSYSGLAAYRYKMIAIRQEGSHKIYTISFRPRQLSNVTVEGQFRIMDSAWVILDAKFTLPNYHIAEYDEFEINQQYSFINDKAWMITRQEFIYGAKSNMAKISGETIVNYHNFELQKIFPKKYFGTEVSVTTQEAYERDSSFWQKTRTEPLTDKEVRFIHYRDSIYRVTHTKIYLDSIDRLTNKVTWKKILFTGQAIYSREKQRTWVLPAAVSMYQPLQFGGARVGANVFFEKYYKSRRNISVSANLSYGIRNHDLNGSIRMSRLYDPIHRGYYRVEVGRGFQYIYSNDAWINLIRRNNFYLNNALQLGHQVELLNGLVLYSDMEIALRRSLTNYKTNSRVDSIFNTTNNQPVAFDPYNAVYGKLTLKYTPGQKFIREPKEKIILGSKWPTFYVSYRRGVPGFINSKVDFEYLEFGMEQELKLGVTGVSKYTIKTGSFISQRDLRLVDYKFERRGDPVLFLNPNQNFQSLDSTFAIFKRFYEIHYTHEFNGAIINKVPFLKKLKLKELVGGGFLYAHERDLRYVELFAGLERVFKWPFEPMGKFKLGVYLVGSAANQFRNPVQVKFGITTWDRGRNKWQ